MKRKRLSIKTRVTLWYTTLLAVLVGLVVAAVLVMSDSMEEMQAKKLLETAVNHAADLLVYDGEDVTFLEPVETYENGIYLLFYDENYRFLDGSWPQKFPNGVDAANRAFQAIRRGNTTYYVYDHLLEMAIWCRKWKASRKQETKPTERASGRTKQVSCLCPYPEEAEL